MSKKITAQPACDTNFAASSIKSHEVSTVLDFNLASPQPESKDQCGHRPAKVLKPLVQLLAIVNTVMDLRVTQHEEYLGKLIDNQLLNDSTKWGI